MNIYLLEQNENTGYDTYDSCIVCVETEDEAKEFQPNGYVVDKYEDSYCYSWTEKENVKCKLIGRAYKMKKGVVIASFNAG